MVLFPEKARFVGGIPGEGSTNVNEDESNESSLSSKVRKGIFRDSPSFQTASPTFPFPYMASAANFCLCIFAKNSTFWYNQKMNKPIVSNYHPPARPSDRLVTAVFSGDQLHSQEKDQMSLTRISNQVALSLSEIIS